MISFLKPSSFLYIGESLTPIWGVFYGFSARLKSFSANLKTFSAKLKTFAANLFLGFIHEYIMTGLPFFMFLNLILLFRQSFLIDVSGYSKVLRNHFL